MSNKELESWIKDLYKDRDLDKKNILSLSSPEAVAARKSNYFRKSCGKGGCGWGLTPQGRKLFESE